MSVVTDVYLAPRDLISLPGSGISWVDEMRAAAARQFAETGLPTLRDEEWKYTNIKPITKLGFQPPSQEPKQLTAGQLQPFWLPDSDAHRLAFVDGRFNAGLSELAGLPQTATIGSLADRLAKDPGSLQKALGSCLPKNQHGFTLLNSAYLSDGAYIEVPTGTIIERPVELLFVSTDDDPAQAIQPRNLVIAGDNSQLTLIERYVSVGETKRFTNALTEIYAGPGARVEHYKLQLESRECYHIYSLFVRQDRDSEVINHNIALGAAIARSDINFALNGPGAHCGLNGLYAGSGRQHIDNHTQVDHVAPHCSSDEYYKGMLADRARAVFRGRIIVHSGAQKTDAQQRNNNLLLSRDAEIDTKPQLEIYADDVKCSHGATVGQLDATALFYLMSRGIDETTARGLLTFAFANDLISRLRFPRLQKDLEKIVLEKLHRRPIEELV